MCHRTHLSANGYQPIRDGLIAIHDGTRLGWETVKPMLHGVSLTVGTVKPIGDGTHVIHRHSLAPCSCAEAPSRG